LGCKLYHKIEYKGKEVSIPHMKAHVPYVSSCACKLEKGRMKCFLRLCGCFEVCRHLLPSKLYCIGIFRVCGLVMHMTDSTELAIIISERMECIRLCHFIWGFMPFCIHQWGLWGLGFHCRTHCWALTTCCKIVDPMPSDCFSSFFFPTKFYGVVNINLNLLKMVQVRPMKMMKKS
jgi:hypothetical protein